MPVLPRAVRLTAILVVLPLCLLHPVARQIIGRERLGPVVFWGLPIAAAAFALLLFPRRPKAPGRPASSTAIVRLLPWCGGALAADQIFLLVAHLLGWVTFTYGDQLLMGHPAATVLLGLPPCLLLGVIGWERALRGGVLAGWAPRAGTVPAVAISALAGTALAAPGILLGSSFIDAPYVAAAFATALCREIAACVIFLSGGGVLLAGLYRGTLMFLEGRLLNDINGLFFPLANFTTSEPLFYLVRGAAAVLAAAVLAFGARRVGRRPGRGGAPGTTARGGQPGAEEA